jgi:hypothetical protein
MFPPFGLEFVKKKSKFNFIELKRKSQARIAETPPHIFSHKGTHRGLRPQPKKGRRVEGKKKQKNKTKFFVS